MTAAVTTGLRVRTATLADLPAVLALLAQDVVREVDESNDAGVPAYVEALTELVGAPYADVLVGEVKGPDGRPQVVATASVYWLRHLIYRGGLVCQVESVRVDASRRGQGLGGRLMAEVERQARERGCARLQLTTNVTRTAAQRFYESNGWVASHVGMKKYIGAEDGR